MNPKVTVIVLNWNGWRDTIDCLESLYQIDFERYQVILVDNCSDDDSLVQIDAYCTKERKFRSYSTQHVIRDKPTTIAHYVQTEADTGDAAGRARAGQAVNCGLTLIKNEQNYGFSEGNNIAVSYALITSDPDYVLLLNNDTVVEKNFLNELVNAAEQDRQIGLLQPKMLYYTDCTIDNTGIECDIFGSTLRRGGYERDEGQYDSHRKDGFFYASGACVLISKNLLSVLSGVCFDPHLFAFGEDLDLSWVARLLDFSIAYCPESTMYHKVGATFGKSYHVAYLSGRNRLRVMIKNYSLATLIFVLPVTIALQFSISLVSCVIHSEFRYIIGFFKALLWNVANLRSALVLRWAIQSTRKLRDKTIMSSMRSHSLELRSVLKGLLKTRYG